MMMRWLTRPSQARPIQQIKCLKTEKYVHNNKFTNNFLSFLNLKIFVNL